MNRFVAFLCATLGVAALTGCDTFDRRSRERADVFAALPPDAQAKLAKGEIEIGNTPDMVYIALGEPSEKIDTTTVAGTESTWVYFSYHHEFAGTARVGYHRTLLLDPKTGRYRVFYEPIYKDFYEEREEEQIRIVFRQGRVAVIEQPKPRNEVPAAAMKPAAP